MLCRHVIRVNSYYYFVYCKCCYDIVKVCIIFAWVCIIVVNLINITETRDRFIKFKKHCAACLFATDQIVELGVTIHTQAVCVEVRVTYSPGAQLSRLDSC